MFYGLWGHSSSNMLEHTQNMCSRGSEITIEMTLPGLLGEDVGPPECSPERGLRVIILGVLPSNGKRELSAREVT